MIITPYLITIFTQIHIDQLLQHYAFFAFDSFYPEMLILLLEFGIECIDLAFAILSLNSCFATS
jgi:hypothetical protein